MQLLMLPQQKGECPPEGSREPAGVSYLGPFTGTKGAQQLPGVPGIGGGPRSWVRAALRGFSAWGFLLGLGLQGLTVAFLLPGSSELRQTFGNYFFLFGNFFLLRPHTL